MSSSRDRRTRRAPVLAALALAVAVTGLTAALPAHAAAGKAAPEAKAPPYEGIGRAATPKEIEAWNIDVRPDFKGLPPGSGSVSRGQEVWESRCSTCHGIFGESRDVFSPIVGGTTKDDIRTGHVARLRDPAYPERTTMMKLSTLSTLWDFIHRAMPWNAPKSLSTDDVYAVTAYILNLADVLPADFVLSDRNMAQVQGMLPNRNGMTTKHAMWPGPELGGTTRPDVQGSTCMHHCDVDPKVASFLPDFARNNNGNLAEQNRLVGPQVGADTTRPPRPSLGAPVPAAPASAPAHAAAAAPAAAPVAVAKAAAPKAAPPAAPPAAAVDKAAAMALMKSHGCVACHSPAQRIVGPAFAEVGRKHADRADEVDYLMSKIRSGGSGVWGPIPMPPQTLPDGDARALAQWIAAGAPQ